MFGKSAVFEIGMFDLAGTDFKTGATKCVTATYLAMLNTA
jgi:hypothetical protein